MSKRALYHEEASRLYIHEDYTLSQLEEYFKGRVSARSLWEWKKEGRWDDKKAKVQENRQDVREMVIKLAKIALQNALDNPDPQNIYAAMATVSRIGQKNFIDIISGVEKEDVDKEEKMSLSEMMDVLTKKLEGK